jgi:hypothetical protein
VPSFEVTVRFRDDVRAQSSATGAVQIPAMGSSSGAAMGSVPGPAMGSVPGPAMSSLPGTTDSPTAVDPGNLSPLSGR